MAKLHGYSVLLDHRPKRFLRELGKDLEKIRHHHEELKRVKAYERKLYYEHLDLLDHEREAQHNAALDAAAAYYDQVRLEAEEDLRKHLREAEEERLREDEEEARQEREQREQRERLQLLEKTLAEREARQRARAKEEEARKQAEQAAKAKEAAEAEKAAKAKEAAEAEKAAKAKEAEKAAKAAGPEKAVEVKKAVEAEKVAEAEKARKAAEAEKAKKAAEAEKAQKERDHIEEQQRRRQIQSTAAEEETARNRQVEKPREQRKRFGLAHLPESEINAHQRYLQIHQNLKKLRKNVREEGKKDAKLRQLIGDMRRSIVKCVGQLREGKGANFKQVRLGLFSFYTFFHLVYHRLI